MASFVVDLSDVRASVRDWPAGRYEAQIVEAELGISPGQHHEITLKLEVQHPELGQAVLYDRVNAGFKEKVVAFYRALAGLSPAEMQAQQAADPSIEIDPDDLVGQSVIVNIAEVAGTGKHAGKTFTNVVRPYYFPASRTDVLGTDA